MNAVQQILKDIDRMTEELERVKKYIMTQAVSEKKITKQAWEKLIQTAKHVKWDNISAVREIRLQRSRDKE